jgi:hypothetical protein
MLETCDALLLIEHVCFIGARGLLAPRPVREKPPHLGLVERFSIVSED